MKRDWIVQGEERTSSPRDGGIVEAVITDARKQMGIM